jgi:hypothetical protein
MNLKESMTKTIAKLINDFQFDCTPTKLDIGDDDKPEYVFVMKSISGRERKVPKFSDKHEIIRVAIDLHKALTDLKSHPEESLNMVIFRLLCSHYQNKPIYRIFTGEGCRSCDSLIETVDELRAKNHLIANNIVVELLYAEAREFRDIMIAHKAKMKPVSILIDADGNEVWSESGHHDSDEVKEKLERIAVQAQPKNNVNHKRK